MILFIGKAFDSVFTFLFPKTAEKIVAAAEEAKKKEFKRQSRKQQLRAKLTEASTLEPGETKTVGLYWAKRDKTRIHPRHEDKKAKRGEVIPVNGMVINIQESMGEYGLYCKILILDAVYGRIWIASSSAWALTCSCEDFVTGEVTVDRRDKRILFCRKPKNFETVCTLSER